MNTKRLLQIGYCQAHLRPFRAFSQHSNNAGLTAYHTRVLTHQKSTSRHRYGPTTCIHTSTSHILPVQSLLQQYTQVRWQSGDAVNTAAASSSSAADAAAGAAAGSTASGTAAFPEGYIPTPPSAMEAIPDTGTSDLALNSLGESTFASLGLNNYTPAGFVQAFIETLHVNIGLPWIPAIAAATLVLRMCAFPIFVAAQKALAQQANLGPTYMQLMMKVNNAKSRRDVLELSKAARDVNDFVQKNDYNPIKVTLAPMANGPIFLSFIYGLRQIAYTVPALKEGGVFWLKDLTVCDPYYILPIVNSLLLALTIEMGTDLQQAKHMKPGVRWALRCMPLGALLFTLNFPAVMCIYWVINSIISMIQAAILRQPKVRAYFKIPQPIDHSQAEKYGVKFGKSKQNRIRSTIDDFQESRAVLKKMRELEDRERLADNEWRKAGSQPIVKTYKYDPTQVKAKANR